MYRHLISYSHKQVLIIQVFIIQIPTVLDPDQQTFGTFGQFFFFLNKIGLDPDLEMNPELSEKPDPYR
jgi:hypothetical protein